VVLIKDLQEKLRFNGTTGVILGSGLGSLADALNEKVSISYNDIESFPVSTVSGHNSDFVSGFYDNNQLLLARGRFHFYEGFDLNTITLPVKVFNQLGVKNIIITNSSGSMNIKNAPGTLMIINGHYDCTFIEGSSMPILKEGEEYYNSIMIKKAKKEAAMNSIKLLEGKYCWTMGPAYETPAEIKFLSKLGGDAVGMSTVPEIEYAKKLNMNILVISALTNFAAGIKDTILTHEDVLVNAKKIGQDFAKILLATVKSLD
jgi:purine-nucleoside phosphorylase